MPNPGGALKPGTFARVRIESAKVDDVLTVPLEAIQYRYGTNRVFVVEGDRLSARELTLGERANGRVEVLGKVKAGDRVAVSDVESLGDGLAVTVKAARASAR